MYRLVIFDRVKTGFYNLAVISDVPELEVIDRRVSVSETDIVLIANKLGAVPLNFSITPQGKILDDCGAFSRFNPEGVCVLLAELATRRGIKGYRILYSKSGTVHNILKPELLAHMDKINYPYIQNAIYRDGAICCYPLRKFLRVEIPEAKRQVTKPQAQQANTRSQQRRMEEQRRVVPQITKNFSPEQSKELQLAKEKGIDIKFLENDKLSKDQLRVLWVSKQKGVRSECFANPNMPVESMKFYADRVFSDTDVLMCKPLLKHPELGVDELTELYACASNNIPYEDLIGCTASEIYLQRLDRDASMWAEIETIDKVKYVDEELLSKAITSIMRLKGLI